MNPVDFTSKILHAPDRRKEWEIWRKELYIRRAELDFSGELYTRPEFTWTQSCFNCYMVMLFDQEFYDPQAGCYRVNREPNFAAKYLLFWPGLDRCSTIGFRCVLDLE